MIGVNIYLFIYYVEIPLRKICECKMTWINIVDENEKTKNVEIFE